MTSSIRTCLWFRDGRGREAAEFYCALIPGSRIEATYDIAGDGASWLIDFTLGGVPYQILDAGPMFTLSEAVSISVETDDQAETDRLLGSANYKWRRGKQLRLAQGSLRCVMAGFPEAADRIDIEGRQECVCQGDRSDDEAKEDRHCRNRSGGSFLNVDRSGR